jgi:hypothetical protein
MALLAYSPIVAPTEVEVYQVLMRSQTGFRDDQGTVLTAAGYIIAAHKIEVATKVPGKVTLFASGVGRPYCT